MKVDYYINKLDGKEKREVVSPFEYRELSSFNKISGDKKELVSSVMDYLYDDEFMNIEQIYNDYYFPISKVGFVPSIAEDGVRFLKPIGLYWDDIDEYKPSIIISKEDFKREYDLIKKYGPMEYAKVTISSLHDGDDRDYHHIFYTSDGCVFINGILATELAYFNTDAIGERLARFCKHHEVEYKRQKEAYSRRLSPNHRNLR